MTKSRFALLLPAVSFCLAAAIVDQATKFDDYVSPGQPITIKLAKPAAGTPPPTDVTMTLYLAGSSDVKNTGPGTLAPAKDAITYQLPSQLPPGRYFLTATSGGTTETVPGELRVKAGGAVRLDSLHPSTVYQTPNGKGFDFDILGDNFSADPASDHVKVDGQGEIIATRDSAKQCAGISDPKKLPCLWVESPQKMHVVGYQAEKYQGPLNLSVQIGDSVSESKPLVLSRMRPSGVFLSALVLFGLLCFAIYRLVARSLEPRSEDGSKLPAWAAFLLDKETNTYSLSKFQLFLFSGVFLFGYVYLFLCHWLVQWQFGLPDVPSEVSGMLGLSAGTTVAAIGATAARGGKGSGRPGRAFSDFVSTGGLVVPERFQFFVWTIVACAGFLALVISQNPATVKGFPDFPQGLLYVMGVSSAGYLGGKLTRKPGPHIRNIAVNKRTIAIQGEYFSDNADFFIDGVKLPLVLDDAGKPKDLSSTRTPQDDTPGFSSKLMITIDAERVDIASEFTFRILNPDGQFSDIRKSNPMTMIDGLNILAGKEVITVPVTGTNFNQGVTASWIVQGQDAKDVPVEYVSATKLNIKLVPGEAGAGTLVLTSPNGSTARKVVTVQAAPQANTMTIDDLNILAGKEVITVQVSGTNFTQGVTASWTVQGQDAKEVPVEYVSATKLNIKLVPGEAGAGTLVLTSPSGSTARRVVTVQATVPAGGGT